VPKDNGVSLNPFNYDFLRLERPADLFDPVIEEYRRAIKKSTILRQRLQRVREYGDSESLAEVSADLRSHFESMIELLREEEYELLGNRRSGLVLDTFRREAQEAEQALAGAQSVRITSKVAAPFEGTLRLVEEFLERCNAVSVAKIGKHHVWKAAGHKTPTQFQRWQRGDDNATDADEQNFRRILAMQPKDFLRLLGSKKLI
jgi:hypothetical protein